MGEVMNKEMERNMTGFQGKKAAANAKLGGTREAFENWAKSLPNFIDITRFENGYSDCNTEYAWAGWQAAQPAQEPTTRVWIECSALAASIHYPECWDVGAYPELDDALNELLAWFKTTGCATCTPPAAPVGRADG